LIIIINGIIIIGLIVVIVLVCRKRG
jgi:hypothetical protein